MLSQTVVVSALLLSSALAFSQLRVTNNQLALDVLRAIPSDNNVFFSPLSIVASLAKLANGAGGQTGDELRHALHIEPNDTLDALNADIKQFNAELVSVDRQNVTLLFADRVYASDEFPLSKKYNKLLREVFGAAPAAVDFENDARNVTKAINKWVSDSTNGKIARLFQDSLSADTRLALINALYFAAKWRTPFPKARTVKAEFENTGGVAALVDTMSLETSLRTAKTAGAQIVELPFATNFSLLVLLPNENVSMEALGDKLTLEAMEEAIARLRPERVALFLPKFKIESEYDLSELLSELDVKRVFSDSADLSAVSANNCAVESLRVSTAVHRANIEVDETGSEAAAATGFVAVPTSLVIPREIRVNRPFAFAVRMDDNGLWALVGQVNSLVDEELLSIGYI